MALIENEKYKKTFDFFHRVTFQGHLCEIVPPWHQKVFRKGYSMTEKFKDRPLIMASPPSIFFACLIAGGILHVLFKAPLGGFPEVIRIWSGIFLLSISGIIAASAFMVLHRQRTSFNPYKATTRIVQKGAFRFSRNPMYLSLALLLIAIALLINAFSFVIMTILFVVIINRGVIRPEETYLEKKFGAEYREYLDKVRRWL